MTSTNLSRLWKTAGRLLSLAGGPLAIGLLLGLYKVILGSAGRRGVAPAPQLSVTEDSTGPGSRPFRGLRRFSIALGVVMATVLGIGAGSAYAYLKSTGSGHGSGAAGTLLPVTVTAVAGTPTTPLVPGGTGDVILNVKNPNAFAVTLVSVTGNPTITAAGGIGTCTTTGVTFSNQSGLSDTIGASGTTQVDLTGAASMSSSSQTGCQGATFSIPVTITVHEG